MGVRRAGLLVSGGRVQGSPLVGTDPIAALGEGARVVQREVLPGTSGLNPSPSAAPHAATSNRDDISNVRASLNSLGKKSACDRCREGMSTSPLLNRLRCADCRQITLQQLADLAFKAALIAIGGLIGWYVASPAKK